jgi:hypothetical protein
MATGIAVRSHIPAHQIAAGLAAVRFRSARWHGGILVALVGIPLRLPAGPFPGERFVPRTKTVAKDQATGADVLEPPRSGASDPLWDASLRGPIVNVLGAVIAFGGYLVLPMPLLRLLIATHLSVAAFSLIAARTLDGSRLGARRPWVAALLALVIAAAATSISVGLV